MQPSISLMVLRQTNLSLGTVDVDEIKTGGFNFTYSTTWPVKIKIECGIS